MSDTKTTKTRIKIDWSGEKLRKILYEKGMSHNYVARRIGVTSSCVYAWLINRNKPSKENIEKLNLLFDVTTKYWEKDKRQKNYHLDEYPSEKAKEVCDRNINPHEADKSKVKENLEKLNGISEEPTPEPMVFQQSEMMQRIADLKKQLDRAKSEIATKDSSIKYLEGVIEGMKMRERINEEPKESYEDKQGFWKKVFG